MENHLPLLQPPVFDYSQLLRLASSRDGQPVDDPALALSDGQSELLAEFMDALGPQGPGLLAVHGIPGLHCLRQALLPLARTLALLPPSKRSAILKDHALGTDVPLKAPDRSVSSFAAQLKFGQAHPGMQNQSVSSDFTGTCEHNCAKVSHGAPSFFVRNSGSIDDNFTPMAGSLQDENELYQLGSLFKQLGEKMLEIGLLVARICDIAIREAALEQAILQSCTAKGRLIHYHATQDELILSANSSKGIHAMKRITADGCKDIMCTVKNDLSEELWQQWHLDYGILTVLTAPMFLSAFPICKDLFVENKQLGTSISMNAWECESPSGHTGLKILNTATGRLEFVSVPPDCLVVQVGEAAQILTGGKLCAMAHCVCRPAERTDISRETYVVFLQPSWEKELVSLKGDKKSASPNGGSLKPDDTEVTSTCDFEDVRRRIPALESRWREGCTFAHFSRETTKQYYGANGVQSKR